MTTSRTNQKSERIESRHRVLWAHRFSMRLSSLSSAVLCTRPSCLYPVYRILWACWMMLRHLLGCFIFPVIYPSYIRVFCLSFCSFCLWRVFAWSVFRFLDSIPFFLFLSWSPLRSHITYSLHLSLRLPGLFYFWYSGEFELGLWGMKSAWSSCLEVTAI